MIGTNILALLLVAGAVLVLVAGRKICESRALKRQLAEQLAAGKRVEDALQESELRFRIVARAANEAVWDWKLDTNAVWWNRGVQTLFEYEDEQVGLSRDWWTANLHANDRDKVLASIEAALRSNDEFWSAEYRFRRADGCYADIYDRGYVLRADDGKPLRMIGAMQDITERKRELEMAKSRDAALESARLKSQFLANMSHEIRTPMNSVIGMAGLLLKTPLTADQREFAEAVQLSGESLLNIINDILDYSKIEAGKLVFEMVDFDLRVTIDEVFRLLAEQAQAKGLKLEAVVGEDVPATLRGDPGRLRQVLTNLVGNAIKFTERGNVTVRAVSDGQTAGFVSIRFTVSDTGVGIPEAARQRLFQPFSQGDASSTRKYGGTGLGLAICKQLVHLMAGQIGVESTVGVGSSFWFTARFEKSSGLPAPTASENEAARVRLELPEERRQRTSILVAEDNVFNQKVIVRQLQDMKFNVVIAGNGIEVLAAIDRAPVDLVLMDCQMPDMDGYETTAEIRRREGAAKRTPIIAMTAHVMPEDREKCLACGMDDFLSKPVRVAHLEQVLAQWLSLSDASVRSPATPPPVEAGENNPAAPVDMATFLEVAGHEGRIPKMAERYIQHTRENLGQLKDALHKGAAADVKRIAHSNAGSSAMCGMTAMAESLRELERLGHTNQLADAPAVYDQVVKEFERVERFFQSYLMPNKTTEPKS